MKAAQQRIEPVVGLPTQQQQQHTEQPIQSAPSSGEPDDCVIYSAHTVAAITDALSFCAPIFDLIYKRTGIADYNTGLTKLRAAQEAMKENSTG